MPAVERAFDRLAAELPRGIRTCLHVRLVELDIVGSGREHVLHFLVDCRGIGHREGLGILVVVVLGLLAHREGAGHGDLDRLVGVPAQKLDVADLHRMSAGNRTDDARHGIGMPRAIERGAVVVHVDAVERGGEAVRIALAPHLAIGDDVESRPFLLVDRPDGRVVLRFLEKFRRRPPQLQSADAWREAILQPSPVDQPVGLRVGTDQRGGKGSGHHALQFQILLY